jgi:mono/diheme cytochrome c family protein
MRHISVLLRHRSVWTVVLALTWTGGVVATEARSQFQANCQGCHQPPDLAYSSDRAWLDQIQRTA